jgi:hypothetical protein
VEASYEVMIRDSRDDDTEGLFVGTERECHIFLDAYLTCLVRHTAYSFDEKNLQADWVYLQSPLISQYPILLTIGKRPEYQEDVRFRFNDGLEDQA